MKSSIECPVDFVKINGNKIRVIAFFVLSLNIAFLLFQHWLIALIAVADFFDRAFLQGKFSLLGKLSDGVLKLGFIKEELTDRGAKRFAAKVGFVFSSVIFVSSILGYTKAAIAFSTIIAVFAFLEAAFVFCAGCIMYSYLKKFKIIQ